VRVSVEHELAKTDFQAGKPPYNVPPSVIETMHRATAELIASGVASRALKAGDKAPAFTLKDPDGQLVSSLDLLAKGALVVSFYRGVWCPYCNGAARRFRRLCRSLRGSARVSSRYRRRPQ